MSLCDAKLVTVEGNAGRGKAKTTNIYLNQLGFTLAKDFTQNSNDMYYIRCFRLSVYIDMLSVMNPSTAVRRKQFSLYLLRSIIFGLKMQYLVQVKDVETL